MPIYGFIELLDSEDIFMNTKKRGSFQPVYLMALFLTAISLQTFFPATTYG
jgi:hypothetical protein